MQAFSAGAGGYHYDLFHVVARYGREVMGRVRVDTANQLRHDEPASGIVSRVRWPTPTGQLAGINHKIKRMAYGFRDSDYFFLKIKAAFPGNA